MRNLSEAKSFRRCFICGEWSWDVCAYRPGSLPGFGGADLCLPCYMDVLVLGQAREARGVMGAETRFTSSARAFTPESDELPGNSPSPYVQLDLFD